MTDHEHRYSLDRTEEERMTTHRGKRMVRKVLVAKCKCGHEVTAYTEWEEE